MPAWRYSVALRLSLAFAVLATVVFAALGLYFSRAADAHMAELDAHELFGKLALIGHIGQQEKAGDALRARLGDALTGVQDMIVAVDGPHAAIFQWPTPALAQGLSAAAIELSPTPVRLTLAGSEYRALAADAHSADGQSMRIVVARNIGHHTDFLDQLRGDFRLAIVAAALLTALIGALIVRRGLHPLRRIAHTAHRISAGQLAERLPVDRVPPELAELVQAFNAMLARLEESFQRLSDFSADLAHELRTPIHSLRMQTEVLLGKERPVAEYHELLASNLEEYERLARIIADMLFLAKADHGLLVPHTEAVALYPLCERLIEYYGLLAEEIDLQLSGEPMTLPGDRLMLERALGNLLGNAIRHTPAGGAISLKLETLGTLAEITMTNSGEPIPAQAIARIFERFVRLDEGTEGNGLGLAITRSIVLAHAGQIEVRTSEHSTSFIIRLPLHATP